VLEGEPPQRIAEEHSLNPTVNDGAAANHHSYSAG
jgi:hypothetical protein